MGASKLLNRMPEKAVPRHFILWVSFDPTATKGVYVHYDKDLNGDSRVGLPGQLAISLPKLSAAR